VKPVRRILFACEVAEQRGGQAPNEVKATHGVWRSNAIESPRMAPFHPSSTRSPNSSALIIANPCRG
jgi:hypothetical protein